jgi:hypothetical protein
MQEVPGSGNSRTAPTKKSDQPQDKQYNDNRLKHFELLPFKLPMITTRLFQPSVHSRG